MKIKVQKIFNWYSLCLIALAQQGFHINASTLPSTISSYINTKNLIYQQEHAIKEHTSLIPALYNIVREYMGNPTYEKSLACKSQYEQIINMTTYHPANNICIAFLATDYRNIDQYTDVERIPPHKRARNLFQHSAHILDIAFSPQDNVLVTHTKGSINLFDLSKPGQLEPYKTIKVRPVSHSGSLGLSPQGDVFLAHGEDHYNQCFYKLPTGEQLRNSRINAPMPAMQVCFKPGTSIAAMYTVYPSRLLIVRFRPKKQQVQVMCERSMYFGSEIAFVPTEGKIIQILHSDNEGNLIITQFDANFEHNAYGDPAKDTVIKVFPPPSSQERYCTPLSCMSNFALIRSRQNKGTKYSILNIQTEEWLQTVTEVENDDARPHVSDRGACFLPSEDQHQKKCYDMIQL